MKKLYLLGVTDPEMRRMETLLKEAGETSLYAMKDGERVHPGNAYAADAVQLPDDVDTLVCIECRPVTVPTGIYVVILDHHRPGDPGYGLPPADYWKASSLGQVHTLLGRMPTQADLVLAAMDHCFPAAVRGECPGVTPEAVITVKCVEAVNMQITAIRGEIRAAPVTLIGHQNVRDLRDKYLGEGYTIELLATQIAATMEGEAALLRHRDRPATPEKITLSGDAQAETVLAFMENWAGGQGLTDIYGVPERGYAGGYIR